MRRRIVTPEARAQPGLRLVGNRHPIAPEAIARAERRDGFAYPPSFRTLLTTWGLGQLCGWLPILDPTDASPHASWSFFRRHLVEHKRLYDDRDRAEISDRTWDALRVWANRDDDSLAWDTSVRSRDGEYPIYKLGRLGIHCRWAADDWQDLIDGYLFDRLDREPYWTHRHDLRATYVTVSCYEHAPCPREPGESLAAWQARLDQRQLDLDRWPAFEDAVQCALLRGDDPAVEQLLDRWYDWEAPGEVRIEMHAVLDQLAGGAISTERHAQWTEVIRKADERAQITRPAASTPATPEPPPPRAPELPSARGLLDRAYELAGKTVPPELEPVPELAPGDFARVALALSARLAGTVRTTERGALHWFRKGAVDPAASHGILPPCGHAAQWSPALALAAAAYVDACAGDPLGWIFVGRDVRSVLALADEQPPGRGLEQALARVIEVFSDDGDADAVAGFLVALAEELRLPAR
jgi:hypothetical protein